MTAPEPIDRERLTTVAASLRPEGPFARGGLVQGPPVTMTLHPNECVLFRSEDGLSWRCVRDHRPHGGDNPDTPHCVDCGRGLARFEAYQAVAGRRVTAPLCERDYRRRMRQVHRTSDRDTVRRSRPTA